MDTDQQHPAAPKSVLIFEPHAGSMKRSVALIKEAGYEALPATTTEEATSILEEESLAALLIAHTPAGVELTRYIREFTSQSASVIAVVSQSAEAVDPILGAMSADSFLRRPLTESTLGSVLALALRTANLRQKAQALSEQVDELEGRLQRSGLTSARTGFHRFEAVKDLLVVEVRRAKRYGYPLAILMIGLDPLPENADFEDLNLPREITAGLAVAISKSIRVIDLPIHYADERILVFLPHTDLPGAEEVGRRIKRRIKRITYRSDSGSVKLTASVGVAGISTGDSLTFSKLIRSANAAIRAAQLKGGDRVMKRVAKPKR